MSPLLTRLLAVALAIATIVIAFRVLRPQPVAGRFPPAPDPAAGQPVPERAPSAPKR